MAFSGAAPVTAPSIVDGSSSRDGSPVGPCPKRLSATGTPTSWTREAMSAAQSEPRAKPSVAFSHIPLSLVAWTPPGPAVSPLQSRPCRESPLPCPASASQDWGGSDGGPRGCTSSLLGRACRPILLMSCLGRSGRALHPGLLAVCPVDTPPAARRPARAHEPRDHADKTIEDQDRTDTDRDGAESRAGLGFGRVRGGAGDAALRAGLLDAGAAPAQALRADLLPDAGVGDDGLRQHAGQHVAADRRLELVFLP